VTEPHLVETPGALEAFALELAEAPRLGLDVEADGLFAYRAKLCALQLSWERGDEVHVAIVDPFLVDARRLRPVLGAEGPVKVLHDLTFDARMLDEAGIELANVRDTSVAARFLGEPATGLARMVESRLGVTLSKDLQDHDWSTRPLGPRELDYLAADVRYLLALEARLADEVATKGIADEVALECAYKLETARRPPRDERPLHARIKGYGELDPVARAVLRRLVEARETLAAEDDVPAFRIARSELLLDLARRKPTSERDVRRICGRDRAARRTANWVRAVALGLDDEPEPRPPAPTPPADLAERKALERTLSSWRRSEAEARGVDPQVVVPGHCMEHVATVLLASRRAGEDIAATLATIEGFGALRVERYARRLAVLVTPGGESDSTEDRGPLG